MTVEKCYKLVIEYDGTCYSGWQRQKDQSTIQETIERVLSQLVQQSVVVNGSGRTDAGVHALGQVASFRCRSRLSPSAFQKAMNSLLPRDIVIRDCCEVPDNFHARFDAVSKIYQYRILNDPIPSAIERNYSWHIQKQLDIAAMRHALQYLVGTHDFKAFEGTGRPRIHTIRTIHTAEVVEKENGYWTVVIKGNGFLRHMVRNIVGTLVDIGMRKTASEDMERILLSRDRHQAAVTAPAQGLFLMEVHYKQDDSVPEPLQQPVF